MATFIELTHEDGHRIILNMDEVVQVAPLGGDERRGCALTLVRRGGETQVRHVRVGECMSTITKALKPLRTRSQPDIPGGMARIVQRPHV